MEKSLTQNIKKVNFVKKSEADRIEGLYYF
jgi:hypothetical protein